MEIKEQKITYQCKGCGHRLLDMAGSDCVIEIKCEKCKRFLRIRSGSGVTEIRKERENAI